MAVRFAIIFTLMFSVYQFLANQEQKRVEQTMSLVELWENKDYQQAQRALKDRLTALNAKYDNLLSANPSPTEEQVFRTRIGIEAMTATGGDMPRMLRISISISTPEAIPPGLQTSPSHPTARISFRHPMTRPSASGTGRAG